MRSMIVFVLAVGVFMVGVAQAEVGYPNIKMHDNIMMFPDLGITLTFNSQTELPFRPAKIKKSQTDTEYRLEIDYESRKDGQADDLLNILIHRSKPGFHMKGSIFMSYIDSLVKGMGAVPGAEFTDETKILANGTLIRHVWIAKSRYAIPLCMDFLYVNDNKTAIIITYLRDIPADKLKEEGPKVVVIR